MEKIKHRNEMLDFLKGIAIIAVVLYHFGAGILPYGYLGVDVFFVISGYLLVKQLFSQIDKNEFNYWKFLSKKIVRLWPLVLIISGCSLVLGYFLMLPDDYENLAESVIASSLFANNILQCITTKNYWDIVNLYKPLMHLWYIGVLMQAFVVLPLIYYCSVKIFKNVKKGFAITTIGITTISLVLFILPFSSAWKFYYLPFRLFEIVSGGILLLIPHKTLSNKIRKSATVLSILILILLFLTRWIIGSQSLMLIITVLATLLTIWMSHDIAFNSKLVNVMFSLIMPIGRKSYSIYIWHQFIIAFLFYAIFPKANVCSFIVFLTVTVIFSVCSFYFVEKSIEKISGIKKNVIIVTISSFLITAIVIPISLIVYFHAGVVRDIPELDIFVNNVSRNMHSEYCDRPYLWDKDFTDDSRISVLVIGNSFGRDWANILYESDYNEQIEISYIYYAEGYSEENLTEYIDRIQQADVIFFAKGGGVDVVPDILEKADNLYVIGDKSYGTSNGIIYAHRWSEDYYSQVVEIDDSLLNSLKIDEELYGERFINLLSPVMANDNCVYVFTDDKKYISQDCRHLTRAGAVFYARILNLSQYLGINDFE